MDGLWRHFAARLRARDARRVRRWWHYTIGPTLLRIIVDRRIRRTTGGIERGERPAVWFSSRPEWEPTATRGILNPHTGEYRTATIAEIVERAGLLVRLEVAEDVVPHTWEDHRRMMDPRVADALEQAAGTLGGDPSEWRLSYDDVPLAKVRSVDASDDGRFWRVVSVGQCANMTFDRTFLEQLGLIFSGDRVQ